MSLNRTDKSTVGWKNSLTSLIQHNHRNVSFTFSPGNITGDLLINIIARHHTFIAAVQTVS